MGHILLVLQRILLWRHNGHDCVPNHQPHHCLLNCLFRRRSKKSSKLRVTGLCAGNSPGTGEFSAQMASNAENVSIWWRHHELMSYWRDMHTLILGMTYFQSLAKRLCHSVRHMLPVYNIWSSTVISTLFANRTCIDQHYLWTGCV